MNMLKHVFVLFEGYVDVIIYYAIRDS